MATNPTSRTPRRRASGDDANASRKGHMLAVFTTVFLLVALMCGAIVFMLVNTTVINSAEWCRKKIPGLNATRTSLPMRGEIYASDGAILATNLKYYELRIDFRSPQFKILEYDSLVGVLSDSLARAYPGKGRTAAQWESYLRKPLEVPKASRPRNYLLLRAMPADEVKRIRKNFPFFNYKVDRPHADTTGLRPNANTGLVASPVITRVYPYGDMARLSIGRVGSVNGSAAKHGISGLEQALDSLLFGKEGIDRSTTGTKSEVYRTEVPAVKGYDVFSTIDVTMQDILEQELGDMLIRSKAKWGSAILMEVATGDIKAISNLEPDTINGGLVEAMNRAVLGYEPGSVAKVMSMAVALNEGYALPITRELPIGHTWTYLKRNISDTHSPATLPISRFLEYSSNIGMVKMSMPEYSGNPNKFRENLDKLGFFDRFNTGISRETRPYYPTLRNDANGMLNLSRMVFGYTTRIPPLYTCAFYNAVANGGRFVRPRIVSGLRLPDGRDSIIPVSYVRSQMLTPEKNAILKAMIHEVVWGQGGTAKALRNDTVEIAGKTGTCKIAKEKPAPTYDKDGNKLPEPPFKGGYLDGHYRVTFCGFFPYDTPKYTCIVVLQDPRNEYRGPAASSGKVLKNVALKLYARGMLDNSSDYAVHGSANDHRPDIAASHKMHRGQILKDAFDIDPTHTLREPARTTAPSKVPDVVGLDVREAIVKLEEAGLNVSFNGRGMVHAQNPKAGTPMIPGVNVHLSLKQF